MSCSEFIFLLLIIMGCDWGNKKMSTLYASDEFTDCLQREGDWNMFSV